MKLYQVYASGVKAALAKLGADKTLSLGDFKAGGKGEVTFPRDHVAAMRVPKGGSSCSNCKYVDKEAHACKNVHYVVWNGGDYKLPDYGLDEICSDWYEPAEKIG